MPTARGAGTAASPTVKPDPTRLWLPAPGREHSRQPGHHMSAK